MSLATPSHVAGLSTLELLADPERLAKHIGQLKAAEESAREQIALVGPAVEIVQIRTEVDSLKAEAAAVLEKAMADADAIVKTASENAKNIVDEAEVDAHSIEKYAAETRRQAEARVADIKATGTAAAKQTEAANQRTSELNRMESTLQQKAADLDKRAQELDGERVKLATVRETISQLLG